jgi:hypothetical protein
MAENNAVAGVYDRHAEAQATIKELQSLGFDMNKLSIVGKVGCRATQRVRRKSLLLEVNSAIERELSSPSPPKGA